MKMLNQFWDDISDVSSIETKFVYIFLTTGYLNNYAGLFHYNICEIAGVLKLDNDIVLNGLKELQQLDLVQYNNDEMLVLNFLKYVPFDATELIEYFETQKAFMDETLVSLYMELIEQYCNITKKELLKLKTIIQSEQKSLFNISTGNEFHSFCKKFVEKWNNLCKKTNLKPVYKLTHRRRKHLKARYPLLKNKLDDLFNEILNSSFLQGNNNRGFAATFDWVIKNEDNPIKILEGKYRDKQTRNYKNVGIKLEDL